MSNLRQAAQQALEALEWVWGGEPLTGKELDAITALRAALAEPAQEPVAWMYDFLNPDNRDEVIRNWVTQDLTDIDREKGFNVRPLYTAPAPRKPLSDEDAAELLGFQRGVHFDAPGGLYIKDFSQYNKDRFRLVQLGWNAAHGIEEQKQ